MRELIVADTGPLIALAKIDHLDLLTQLYKRIHIPQTVFKEATQHHDWQDALQISEFVGEYIEIVDDADTELSKELLLRLDAGESQAIALAHKLNCPILLDEKRGRTIAKQKQIEILGTIGLLITAKQQGLIPEIGNLLKKISNNGYRISAELIQKALIIVGEA